MTVYRALFRLLAKMRKRLNIVIIGANDGRINDPSYDLIMRHRDRTDVLLVEPNTTLIPFLRENYATHPSHFIANCAIGPGGTIDIYVVKESYWQRFQPDYAKGWPEYRAATGITSVVKAHVEGALLQAGLDPREAMEAINVPVKSLSGLCDESSWPTPVDILQIDAEGYDDSIILSSNLERIRPKVILFESQNLTESRKEALAEHLKTNRYKLYELGGNGLALESGYSPVDLSLRFAAALLVSFPETAKRLYHRLKRIFG